MKKGFTQSRRATEEIYHKEHEGRKAREARNYSLCSLCALWSNLLRLCCSACKTFSAATVLKLFVAFALVLPVAACGTKTELLLPNGKPTPRDQRDPSQPPSPISR